MSQHESEISSEMFEKHLKLIKEKKGVKFSNLVKGDKEINFDLDRETNNKLDKLANKRHKSREETVKDLIVEDLNKKTDTSELFYNVIGNEGFRKILREMNKEDVFDKIQSPKDLDKHFTGAELRELYSNLKLDEITQSKDFTYYFTAIKDLMGIPINDRLQNYQLFFKWASLQFKEVEELSREQFKIILENTHIFELSDSISEVLKNTKAEEQKLPFNNLFISSNLKIDETYIVGIWVVEGEPRRIVYLYATKEKQSKDDEEGWRLNLNFAEENNKIGKQIINFINSFVCFINEPEVEYRKVEYSESNTKRRAERGLIRLPSNSVITLKGKIKEYIDRVESERGLRKLTHRFWVRGHFKHLSASRYKVKKQIWIKPFGKGNGILVKKNYEVLNEIC